MATAQIYHRSNMSASGSISRKRVGSMSSRGNETPLSPLDIQSIQMPANPQNALALKTAALSSTKSLYQTCSTLRRRLKCVDGFPPFLDQPPSAERLDVVSHMVHIFRLGTPLCHLYNLLIPAFTDPQSALAAGGPPPKPLDYEFPSFMECPSGVLNWAKRPENAKDCQRYIAKFTMAMNQRRGEGRWNGEMWAINELYGKTSGEEAEIYDSTGLMKVLHTVEAILDHLPDSAMSPMSPTTPFTSSSQFFSAKGHISKQSYDLPFSMGGSGSGMNAVETMAATMNGGVQIEASGSASIPTGGEAMSRAMSKSSADSNAFKSVEELVASEKSYVQELEILVRYSTELMAKQIISTDTNHAMFSNLSKILDFHRKFLIKLETEYEPIQEGRTWAEGRWGRPFVSSESEFDCYGPYCANYLDAISLVNEQLPNLLRGQDLPADQRPCLHPETELQPFMIKPIQRITKYFLLLDAVLNATKKHDYAYRTELEEGAAAVRRIAATINEVTDFKAKQATVRELIERVDDWKGHKVLDFGDLWLDDHFTVLKANSPREYHVFLFDRMLLCCKEVEPERKKSNKSSSMLRKDRTSSKVSIPDRKKLDLKGRIFLSNVVRATLSPSTEPYGGPQLTIGWSIPQILPDGTKEDVEDSFLMVGRPEEQMKKWADKVIELARVESKRQAENRGKQVREHEMKQRMSGSRERYSTDAGQQSAFEPRTPASETPPYGFPPPLPGQEGDEESMPRSGRNTPSIGSQAGYVSLGQSSGRRVQSQQSVPRGSFTELRARAMTEDQFGPSVSQWRNQHQAPPMPRLMSNQSTASNMSEASFGTMPRSARQMSQSRITRGIDEESEPSPTEHDLRAHQRYAPARGMARAPSHQMTPSVPHPHAPPMRSRSASQPHVYPLTTDLPMPPVPNSAQAQNGWQEPPYPVSSSSTLVGGGGAAYFKRRSGGGKRSSGDSHSTETSETSSQISPSTPYGMNPSEGPLGSRKNSEVQLPAHAGTMLVRARCQDDQFIIGVPASIAFGEFYQKVQKKIRMCRGASQLSDRIVIKWIDLDGDEVTIKCDADVEGMFEETRDSGSNCVNIVVR